MEPAVITAIAAVATVVVSAFGTVGALVWWLSGQFHEVISLVQASKDEMSKEIAAHERLDLERFDGMNVRLLRVEYSLPKVEIVPREQS